MFTPLQNIIAESDMFCSVMTPVASSRILDYKETEICIGRLWTLPVKFFVFKATFGVLFDQKLFTWYSLLKGSHVEPYKYFLGDVEFVICFQLNALLLGTNGYLCKETDV